MMLFFLIGTMMIDSFFNDPLFNSIQCGICVYDLKNDTVIYARDARKLLVPASNLKIITTSAALQLLGSDHRFTTRLIRIGSHEDGVIDGDIMLIGSGDPTLGVDQINRLIENMKKAGVKRITGNILINDDYFTDLALSGNSFTFERLPVGWSWHYLDARYGAEISALNFNENSVTVAIRHEIGDSMVTVSIRPETDYVRLVNRMTVKEGEDSIIVYRLPESNTIYVGGGVKAGRRKDIPVAVKDPALLAGNYFLASMKKSGIEVNGIAARYSRGIQSGEVKWVTIDSVLSPSLLDILRRTNVESVNLYAETLIKSLGARFYGEGTFNKGLIVIRAFLSQCGVDTANVSLWDGSGLSRHNLLAPVHMVQVLRYMYRTSNREVLMALLPLTGEGTLEYRFKNFEGSLRAKTGSIHAVSCLSGYLTVNGNDYCFSMMFNNFAGSRRRIEAIQEKIIIALNDHLGGRPQ